MGKSKSFHLLWAKKNNDRNTWLPLDIHLQDTVSAAQRLWNIWVSDGTKKVISESISGSTEDALNLLTFLAAAHDIGKVTPVFQSKTCNFYECELDQIIEERIITSGLPYEKKVYYTQGSNSPHALAGYQILKRNKVNESVAIIISSHHGKPADNKDAEQTIGANEENYYVRNSLSAYWIKVQNEFLTFALSLAGYTDTSEIPQPTIPGQVLLSALLIVADWISSNELLYPHLPVNETGESLDIVQRGISAWNKLNFPPPWQPDYSYTQDDFFKLRFNNEDHNFEPNELQSKSIELAVQIDTPGIFIIESTMGSGKTEAALSVAEIFASKTGKTGIYFALPTQATSNSMFSRMLNWIDHLDNWAHTVKLSHGKAQFNETFEGLQKISSSTGIFEDDRVFSHLGVVHEWFEGQKKTMLADFVVGTIDQILLSALKQKHVMLRHLGLSNKVVIIDECHAYDTYMSQFLMKALTWLASYQVPVIILSATLPIQKRNELVQSYLSGKGFENLKIDNNRSYPLLTYTDNEKILQQKVTLTDEKREIQILRITDENIIDELVKYTDKGGVIGIILNTVARAQQLSLKLKEVWGENIVELIHSRFTAADRLQKEKELTVDLGRSPNKRPDFKIVVGTQVLEQSLDIDFDLMLTDLCPMDLLLQRIGRLQRHSRLRLPLFEKPICMVISPEDGEFEQGSRSIYSDYLLLKTACYLPSIIHLPDDIPNLVQTVYDESAIPYPELPLYSTSFEKWKEAQLKSISYSKAFQIPQLNVAPGKTIKHWLSTDLSTSEHIGRAAVRDGDESVEVIVLYKDKAGHYRTFPWIENGVDIPSSIIPNKDESRIIAKQSIHLPLSLCYPGIISKTIRLLEDSNQEISCFQQAPLLRGELFLILNDEFKTVLNGYEIEYNQKLGLLHKEIKKND